GRPIGEGTLTQWIEDGNLHVVARYEMRDGRRIEEQSVLAQRPELRQLRWSWEERRGDQVVRAFSVDQETGHAVARKRAEDGDDSWDEHLDDARGAFCGIGFMYAVKNLTERLDRGERIELTAVAFTPKPRTSTVAISRDQVGELTMAGRALPPARDVIDPEVPAAAEPFVQALD